MYGQGLRKALEQASDELRQQDNTGPKCDVCQGHSKVVDSRGAQCFNASSIRRRRECINCKNRWTTYEISTTIIREAQGKIKKAFKIR